MYRHFMKDTKGKELKHNAVETSGRLASYYNTIAIHLLYKTTRNI